MDPYVLDALMPDLVGHDKRPSAFLVYLALWRIAGADASKPVRIALGQLALATGLSRSTVQHALNHLVKRQLIAIRRASATAIPAHTVLRPWARRRGAA